MTNKPAKAGIFLAGPRLASHGSDRRLRKHVGTGFPSEHGLSLLERRRRHAEAIKEIA
jgi:hypothetical protein